MAYCDVAMNSTSYCEGAEHAVTLVQRHGGALVAVATWSFTGGGVLGWGLDVYIYIYIIYILDTCVLCSD